MIALNPEVKFSNFLKKIPANANNPIDKIIQEQPENNNDINISDVQGDKQIWNENTKVDKEKIADFNVYEVKNFNEVVDNPNEILYFEREISTEEEAKLRSALINHFIFQDLNEEIM